MSILITGGCGYIGSHLIFELLSAGKNIVVVDNLSRSNLNNFRVIEQKMKVQIPLYTFSLGNREGLETIFQQHQILGVIHLAGLKSVKESMFDPLKYYSNNLSETLILLEVMKKYQCFNLIFSSSATVYDASKLDENWPTGLTEDASLGPINPYGRTKLQIEEILHSLSSLDNHWRIVSLRYFNPIGAHPSGLIGEDPIGDQPPENLMPYILQVISGQRPCLTVFGNDYSTPDGTCIRDYIHIVDLAQAHLATWNWLTKTKDLSYQVFNIGTGIGYSVLQVIEEMAKQGKKITYEIGPRRPGDQATVFANPSLAQYLLDWKAQKGLKEMCQDAYNWWSQRRLRD